MCGCGPACAGYKRNVPGYGLRPAASTLLGSACGEQDTDKMRRTAWISVLVTVCMMCVSGLILYIGSVPLMRLFSPSAAVVTLGAEMLRLVALSEPFFGLMVVLEGIFYGMGRTRYPFLVETIGMWGIRIFLTFLCVNVWGAGPSGSVVLHDRRQCGQGADACGPVSAALSSPVREIKSERKAGSEANDNRLRSLLYRK